MKTPTVLESRRRQMGLSQDELGALAGVSRSSIANWETRASQPRPSVADLISSLIGVSSVELLDDAQVDQLRAAQKLVDEMKMCGDVGVVDVVMILDSLHCAGLHLERGGLEASDAFLNYRYAVEVAP
jgi:transcriptional regulator with XRE-family HTH domain